MLILKNIEADDKFIDFVLLVNGNENELYHVKVDANDREFHVISSDVPEEYKGYEGHARIALRKCNGKYPKEIKTMWY